MDLALKKGKCILFANSDWYLYNFRLATMRALRCSGYDVVILSPTGAYVERMEREGFRHVVAPLSRRSVNPFRELSLLLWLWRFLRKERPAVVHGFTIKCAVYGALIGKAAGVPCRIAAIAGMGLTFTHRKGACAWLRWSVKRLMAFSFSGKGTIVVTQNGDDAAEILNSRVADPASVFVIRGSGVDLERFRPRRRVVSRNEPLKVIFASRLLWSKGIGEYIEAAQELKQKGHNAEFYLAGTVDSSNPGSCKQADVDAWHKEGVVAWLGHREDMASLLRKMDVMVLPSYYREGVPKCLLEAAATGLAIVTTDMPGCRDVVSESGRNGLQVPPRDAAAVLECIVELDGDREYCAQLGREARRHAEMHFDERLVVSRTLALYPSVAGYVD